MALIGEAGGGRDFGQRQLAIAQQFDGVAKAQVNDIAMRTDADLRLSPGTWGHVCASVCNQCGKTDQGNGSGVT